MNTPSGPGELRCPSIATAHGCLTEAGGVDSWPTAKGGSEPDFYRDGLRPPDGVYCLVLYRTAIFLKGRDSRGRKDEYIWNETRRSLFRRQGLVVCLPSRHAEGGGRLPHLCPVPERRELHVPYAQHSPRASAGRGCGAPTHYG